MFKQYRDVPLARYNRMFKSAVGMFKQYRDVPLAHNNRMFKSAVGIETCRWRVSTGGTIWKRWNLYMQQYS